MATANTDIQTWIFSYSKYYNMNISDNGYLVTSETNSWISDNIGYKKMDRYISYIYQHMREKKWITMHNCNTGISRTFTRIFSLGRRARLYGQSKLLISFTSKMKDLFL